MNSELCQEKIEINDIITRNLKTIKYLVISLFPDQVLYFTWLWKKEFIK
jgi:hypothetical protein